MDDLISTHGGGIRLLLLFKLLKVRVIEKAKQTKLSSRIDEETLNKLCMQKAYQLLKRGGENPTEKDIKELLSRLPQSRRPSV
ncbi:MAG: hypothetical protein QXO15_05500 [Nitrososphaerota archaeon]